MVDQVARRSRIARKRDLNLDGSVINLAVVGVADSMTLKYSRRNRKMG